MSDSPRQRKRTLHSISKRIATARKSLTLKAAAKPGSKTKIWRLKLIQQCDNRFSYLIS